MKVEFELVAVENPEELNLIFGMSHFIKTVEDIHEAIVQTNPGMRFGIAFCEASGPRLIRVSGNDDRLQDLAALNAGRIGAGHTFIVFIDNGFPVNILNTIKMVPEVCRIFCATANPLQVIVAANGDGQRGVMGVLDGYSPMGRETDADRAQRIGFLRTIGYKLGE
ncbi:adenosine-specific kinase [bacterium]|nr:adenosine-specific kinase [candidate division CSSED10-310 bacterium]